MKATPNLQSDLGAVMRARADKDNLPADHLLRTLADRFDLDLNGYMAQEQTSTARQFLSSWARARRAWGAYSGDQLIDVCMRDLIAKEK